MTKWARERERERVCVGVWRPLRMRRIACWLSLLRCCIRPINCITVIWSNLFDKMIERMDHNAIHSIFRFMCAHFATHIYWDWKSVHTTFVIKATHTHTHINYIWQSRKKGRENNHMEIYKNNLSCRRSVCSLHLVQPVAELCAT